MISYGIWKIDKKNLHYVIKLFLKKFRSEPGEDHALRELWDTY